MSNEMRAEKSSVAQFGSAEIAQVLGIGVRRLQQLTKEGIIPKIAHGKYEIAEVVPSYLAWRISQCEETEDEALDLRKERTLLIRVQRKKAEVELSVMKGELHKSADVERVMNNMLSAFRARCLAIPNRASPMISGKAVDEVRTIIKAEIYEALQELAEYEPDAFYQPPEYEEVAGDG